MNKGAKNGPDISANWDTIWTSNKVANQYRNYQQTWEPTEATSNSTEFWTGSAAPANIRASCWTNAIDNTYVTWPSTIRPVPKSLMQEKIN